MIVVFIGPPGSGKGTQAQMLADEYNFNHVSTGDLFRSEIKEKTQLGLEIKEIIETGGFVSDEIVLRLIDKVIVEINGPIILDGCPRTLNQAKKLEKVLKKHGKSVDVVLDFVVDFDKIVDRISGRVSCARCGAVYHMISNRPQVDGVCDKCGYKEFKQRSDDKENVVRGRVEIFHKESGPIKEFYEGLGLLVPINGDEGLKKVSLQLRKKLNIE
jgi:adenylate kinase